jgi:hypothetical protein
MECVGVFARQCITVHFRVGKGRVAWVKVG